MKVIGQGAMAVKAVRQERRATKATEPLSTRHYGCNYHREPFRDSWPKGWDRFVAVVMGHLLERAPNFARSAQGNIDNLARLLDDMPACDWLKRDQLMEAYHESGVGYKARCSICNDKRVGTRYLLRLGQGLDVPYRHVCFACLVDKKGGIATKGGVTA